MLAELTDALAQLRRGRFDVRLPRREGAAGALADQFNDMAAVAQRHNRDLLRIGRSVGREGRMGDRLDEESYDGAWADGRPRGQRADRRPRPRPRPRSPA